MTSKRGKGRQPPSRENDQPDDGSPVSDAAPVGPPGVPALPARLPDDLKQALQKANLDPQNVMLIEMAFKYSSYRSNWPPPELIEGYEKALPGTGKMILEAAKGRAEARSLLEQVESERSDLRMRRGQIFGFVIAMTSLILAGILGIYGGSWLAAVIAVTALVAGIGGPAVARVIADKIHLDLQKEQQPKGPAR